MSKKPSDLKTILLTHCHTPYVRGVSVIEKATGARVAIHEEDADYLSGRRRCDHLKDWSACCSRSLSPSSHSRPSSQIRGSKKMTDCEVLLSVTSQVTLQAVLRFTMREES